MQQGPQALTTIRLLISLLPAALLVASILVARSYPITRLKHAEIQAQLADRRKAQSAEL